MISHWDEVEYGRRESGHIGGDWASLTGRSSVTVGVTRIRVHPGRWSTPAHVEGSEEEIFFVLDGSGVSWQDGSCYAVRAGDFLLHRAGGAAHTLRAGDEGLDVLAFGERHPFPTAYLPRAEAMWLGRTWTRGGAGEDHPWRREAAVGEPEVGELLPRPAEVKNLDELEVHPPDWEPGQSRSRNPGRALGSVRTGVQHAELAAGDTAAPPHMHSAEEEIFVVLAGGGELELTPAPTALPDAVTGTFAVRAGSVIARPAGTRVAHGFRAGDEGMTLLAYGTRDANDVVYYPRSNKIYFRGVGLMARLEHLDYWDGEE